MNTLGVLVFLRAWCKTHTCDSCPLYHSMFEGDFQRCVGSDELVMWSDAAIEAAAKLVEAHCAQPTTRPACQSETAPNIAMMPCPACGRPWNTKLFNACECGASIARS